MGRLEQPPDEIFGQGVRPELIAYVAAGFDGAVDRSAFSVRKRASGYQMIRFLWRQVGDRRDSVRMSGIIKGGHVPPWI